MTASTTFHFLPVAITSKEATKSYYRRHNSKPKFVPERLDDTAAVEISRTMRATFLSRPEGPVVLMGLLVKLLILTSGTDRAIAWVAEPRVSLGRGKQQHSSSHQSFLTLLQATNSPPPPYPVRIAVMGGGNFGLALATVAARNGIPTTLLVRSKEDADCINENHYHPRKMSDFILPSRIRATHDPAECLPDATYIIHAVPVQYSRKFLESVTEYIPPSTPILSGSKGIETASLGFMADILKESLGNERSYAFLSGPSFAREICEGVATAVVIASEDLLLARDLAELLSDEAFRVFTSKDVIGVEIGGAVKNVIALAAGMCEGLGLGTNAMSGLVTRGCGEMRRLGKTFGARPSTISGLSGVGDTFGTCFGPLSRNRKFGYRLGKGETMEEILASTTEVAEGVDTSIALINFIKKNCKGYRMDLKYPILFGIAAILQGQLTPREGLKGIMDMPFLMENFDER